jgi:hypothetical protein
MHDDIELFRQASLTPADVADLLNVSRVTGSRWLNGHFQPHALIRDRVSDLAGRVKNLLDNGSLPLATAAKSSGRYAALRSMLYGDNPTGPSEV